MTTDPRDRPLLTHRPALDTENLQSEHYQAYGLDDYFGEVLNTVVFHQKDGSQFAKPYYRLDDLDYDPTNGIWLSFTGSIVTVCGRNLFPLFTALCDFKVRWIREAVHPTALLVPDLGTVVEAVKRKPLTEGRSP